MTIQLSAEGLRKTFNRRTIFDGVTFTASQGQTVLVTGRNGSGKSTLVKLLAHVLTPSSGGSTLTVGDRPVSDLEWPSYIGLVSPYLQLYEEFSAEENLGLALTMRGWKVDSGRVLELLGNVQLGHRAGDVVRTYSSGMKQRMKLAFALIHRPAVLFLDEPMTNLDADGIALVRRTMRKQRESGILVVATNDLTDVEEFEAKVDLDARR